MKLHFKVPRCNDDILVEVHKTLVLEYISGVLDALQTGIVSNNIKSIHEYEIIPYVLREKYVLSTLN